MNEDARRRARTQGRYSLDNKWDRKDGNTPPETRLIRSVNNQQSGSWYERRSFGESSAAVSPLNPPISRLNYENSGQNLAARPIPRNDFKKEHFGKWINLDPTAKTPSLVYYDPNFLHADEADLYYEMIKSGVKWEQKVQYRDGETVPVPRLTCWFGPMEYSYGKGIIHEPNKAWFPQVTNLKTKIETYLKEKCQLTDYGFNSVLLNYYRDCKDGVAWHSDDETTMGVQPTIASVSLGETRKFELKRYSGIDAEWRIHLQNGSLLIMSGNTQIDWKHRVPTEYHDKQPRINLTYRNIQPV